MSPSFNFTALLAALLGVCAVPSWVEGLGSLPANWIGGHVTTNTTLTLAAPGPTYYLYGDLTVEPGVTLIIEPGVQIRAFAKTDYFASGAIVDRAEIVVAGWLQAAGTETSRISMSSTGGESHDWGGITVLPTGIALLSYGDLERAWNGVTVAGVMQVDHVVIKTCYATGCIVQESGVLTVTASALDAMDTGVYSQGTLGVAGTTIRNCAGRGVHLVAGNATLSECNVSLNCSGVSVTNNASLTMRGCVLQGPSQSLCSGIGLYINNATVNTNVLSPDAPIPTEIRNFRGPGVAAYGLNGVLRNLLIHDNEGTGVEGRTPDLEYVTIARNGNGVYDAGHINNSIISDNGSGVNGMQAQLAYTDVWGNSAWNFNGMPTAFGPHVAVFNPGFVSPGTGNFHLGPASLFVDFGSTGGEIGAYGPGAGAPVAIRGATVIGATASQSGVRVEWLSAGAGGATALICRSTETDDWAVVGQATVDATEHVVYEDADVVPGQAYLYGIGVRTATGVAVEGQVSVNVPAIARLAMAQMAVSSRRNPEGITLSVPRSGTVHVEFFSPSGRLLGQHVLEPSMAGNHDVPLPAGASGARGIVFVRARQGEEQAIGKVLLL